jgi:conjugal transfer pilus assembly protein TraE
LGIWKRIFKDSIAYQKDTQMNEIIRDHTLRSLTVQRNSSLAIVFLLLAVTVALSLLLFKKTERVIIVPAILEKEFWVDGLSFSPTYIEQIGCFIGDLLLTRSPASAEMQLTLLMRHTDPSFAGTLGRKLSTELSKLQKDQASYVFFRTKAIVEMESQSLLLEGDRVLFLGDKILSTARERYRLGFNNQQGRLLLASIERVEEN